MHVDLTWKMKILLCVKQNNKPDHCRVNFMHNNRLGAALSKLDPSLFFKAILYDKLI